MNIDMLAAILGGIGGGSLLTMVVKHFLDKDKIKAERQIQLQKEIYFELQKRAKEIFDGLFILDHRFDQHNIIIEKTLNNQIQVFVDLPDEFKKERVRVATNLQLFFPNVSHVKYNECVNLISKTGELYLEVRKKMPLEAGGEMEKEEKNKILYSLNEQSKIFKNNMRTLANEIMQILEDQKSKIIS